LEAQLILTDPIWQALPPDPRIVTYSNIQNFQKFAAESQFWSTKIVYLCIPHLFLATQFPLI